MYKAKYWCWMVLVWHLPCLVRAQFYPSGQDGAEVRWRQHTNPTFLLIYPEGMDSLAAGYARYLQSVAPSVDFDLGHQPKPFPVILRPYTSASNGYVTWAPKRMELFTQVPSGNLPVPWYQQLALHEYRHVVQTDMLNNGFTRGVGWFFGQQSVGIASLFVPRWFFEGDAVDAETRLGLTGRGALPEFAMACKMLANEHSTPYPYSKMLFGSYRHHVPDAYEWGYQMVRYGRETYGSKLWASTLQYTGRHWFTLMPFDIGLRKSGAPSRSILYGKAIAHLRDTLQTKQTYPGRRINPPGKSYHAYRSPCFTTKGIVALKTGLDVAPRIVLIDSAGHERLVVRTGYVFDNWINARRNLIVWSEYQPHERWSNRSYAEIRIYNTESRALSTLAQNTRWFMPALSANGSKLALIENDSTASCRLLVVDLATQAIQFALQAPAGMYFQSPAWEGTSDTLMVIANSERGKQIIEVSADGTWRGLTSPTFDEISNLQWAAGYLYYHGTGGGHDAIYALDTEQLSIYEVVSGPYGCFDPLASPDGRRMVYVGYHTGGYELYRASANELNYRLAAMPPADTGRTEVVSARPEPAAFASSPYRKLAHSVNIHSWAPLYYSVDAEVNAFETIPVYPGLQMFSQDLTGNNITSAGVYYNKLGMGYNIRTRWMGLYPVFDLSVSGQGERSWSDTPDIQEPADHKPFHQAEGRIYFPLNFSKGSVIQTFTPQMSCRLNNNGYYNYETGKFTEGMIFADLRLSGAVYRRMAVRDIWPRLGISYNVVGRTMPADRYNFGSMGAAYVGVWLPGIGRHHAQLISLRWSRQVPQRYYMPYRFAPGRGYQSVLADEMVQLSVNYTLPVAYPDLNIGCLVYFKRLRATLFSDSGWWEKYGLTNNFWSTGTEWTLDFYLGHLPIPFALQWQAVYLTFADEWQNNLWLTYTLSF